MIPHELNETEVQLQIVPVEQAQMPPQLTPALVHEIVDIMMQMREQLWIVKNDIKTELLASLALQICEKLVLIH